MGAVGEAADAGRRWSGDEGDDKGDVGDAGGVTAASASAAAAVTARMRLSPSSHSRLRRGDAVLRVGSYASRLSLLSFTAGGAKRVKTRIP